MSTPIVSRSQSPGGAVSQIGCAVCGVTNKLLRCSRCKTTNYCSKEHQIIDWRHHKAFCSSKALDGHYDINKLTIDKTSTRISNSKTITDVKSSSTIAKNGIVSSNLKSQAAGEITRIQTGEREIERKIEKNRSADNRKSSSQTDGVASGRTKKGHGETRKSASTGRPEGWTMPITYAGSSEDTILGARGQSLNPSVESSRMIGGVEEEEAEDEDVNTKTTMSATITERNNRRKNGMKFPEVSLEEDYHLPPYLHSNRDTREEFIIDDVCRNVIRDMNKFGVCVVDSFLGHEKGVSVLNEVLNMYSAGLFEDGQLVSNRTGNNDLKTIRGDQITWLDGKEKHCENIGMLISKVDSIIIRANRMPNNGKLADYTINERTKAMVACYPGRGSHYVKHVDNPNRDGRCITAIYYLNKDWDIKKNGGLLRIFPEGGRDQVADIEPLFDRILFFWSDRRNPHEVQPAFETRYAITLWYFDAEERSEACRRYQMEREVRRPGARGARAVIETPS